MDRRRERKRSVALPLFAYTIMSPVVTAALFATTGILLVAPGAHTVLIQDQPIVNDTEVDFSTELASNQTVSNGALKSLNSSELESNVTSSPCATKNISGCFSMIADKIEQSVKLLKEVNGSLETVHPSNETEINLRQKRSADKSMCESRHMQLLRDIVDRIDSLIKVQSEDKQLRAKFGGVAINFMSKLGELVNGMGKQRRRKRSAKDPGKTSCGLQLQLLGDIVAKIDVLVKEQVEGNQVLAKVGEKAMAFWDKVSPNLEELAKPQQRVAARRRKKRSVPTKELPIAAILAEAASNHSDDEDLQTGLQLAANPRVLQEAVGDQGLKSQMDAALRAAGALGPIMEKDNARAMAALKEILARLKQLERAVITDRQQADKALRKIRYLVDEMKEVRRPGGGDSPMRQKRQLPVVTPQVLEQQQQQQQQLNLVAAAVKAMNTNNSSSAPSASPTNSTTSASQLQLQQPTATNNAGGVIPLLQATNASSGSALSQQQQQQQNSTAATNLQLGFFNNSTKNATSAQVTAVGSPLNGTYISQPAVANSTMNGPNITLNGTRTSPLIPSNVTATTVNLTKAETLESYLETAPKGLILRVIAKGESNLQVGQLVDGNLKLIAGSNATTSTNATTRTLVANVTNLPGNTTGPPSAVMPAKITITEVFPIGNATAATTNGTSGSNTSVVPLKLSNATTTTTTPTPVTTSNGGVLGILGGIGQNAANKTNNSTTSAAAAAGTPTTARGGMNVMNGRQQQGNATAPTKATTSATNVTASPVIHLRKQQPPTQLSTKPLQPSPAPSVQSSRVELKPNALDSRVSNMLTGPGLRYAAQKNLALQQQQQPQQRYQLQKQPASQAVLQQQQQPQQPQPMIYNRFSQQQQQQQQPIMKQAYPGVQTPLTGAPRMMDEAEDDNEGLGFGNGRLGEIHHLGDDDDADGQ